MDDGGAGSTREPVLFTETNSLPLPALCLLSTTEARNDFARMISAFHLREIGHKNTTVQIETEYTLVSAAGALRLALGVPGGTWMRPESRKGQK